VLAPKARGRLGEVLLEALRNEPASWHNVLDVAPEHADDLQLCLWALYELHYRGFDDVSDALEWHPGPLTLRHELELRFEAELRERYRPRPLDGPFADALFSLVAHHEGPSLAAYVQRDASVDHVLELLRMRSVYHLKESDPVAWVVPRLSTVPKAALMELQFDEYGGGDPNKVHAQLFARGLEACGLRSEYGAYLDEAPVEVLEQNNAMSLFGLHRRHRGAALGHLAAFEATSSMPSRRLAQGLERLGLPAQMIAYYREHVEADAVHEQLAVRLICGALVDEDPALAEDVTFGAFTCLDLEARLATRVLGEWTT